MKKQNIKLNESQLRNIIKENIKKVLNENYLGDYDDNDDDGWVYAANIPHRGSPNYQEEEKQFYQVFAKQIATLRKMAQTQKKGSVDFERDGFSYGYEVWFKKDKLRDIFEIGIAPFPSDSSGHGEYAGSIDGMIRVVAKELMGYASAEYDEFADAW